MKRIIFLALLFAASFKVYAVSDILTATQRTYVDSLLTYNPKLYILDESEFNTSNLSFVKEEYHTNPYYVSADFNKDGLKDFAVLLGVKDSSVQRCLVVFNGKPNSRYEACELQYEGIASPFFYEDNINNSLFVAFRKNLFIAAVETDISSIFIPYKHTYILQGSQLSQKDNSKAKPIVNGMSHSLQNRTVVKKPAYAISISTRKEFAAYANYTFEYVNSSFISMVIEHFSRLGYDIGTTSEIMETLYQHPKEFDEVLKAIWNQSSHDSQFLFMQFKSFGVSSKTANDLTKYTMYKFSK